MTAKNIKPVAILVIAVTQCSGVSVVRHLMFVAPPDLDCEAWSRSRENARRVLGIERFEFNAIVSPSMPAAGLCAADQEILPCQ